MTAVLGGVTCTRQLIDAAPVGARLVRDFGEGVKLCVHKIEDGPDGGWRYGLDGKVLAGMCTSAASLAAVHRGAAVTIHHPAPALVRVCGPSFAVCREWYCRICREGAWPYLTAAEAADDARAHVANHALAGL